MRLLQKIVTAVLAAWLGSSAWASNQLIAQLDSPQHVLNVKVWLGGGGELYYDVSRQGQIVVQASRLGFLLSNAPALDSHFSLARQSTQSHDDTWEQPWGERRYVRNRYNQLSLDLVQAAHGGRHLGLVFRAFDDGVGFRYEFPDQASLPEVKILSEQTEFAIAAPATAWWTPGGEWLNLEYLVQKTPLKEVAQANTPLTLKTTQGVYVSVHEAALVDFAGMQLRRVDGQRLKAQLTPASLGPPVERRAPFATPWRTLVIAGSAPALFDADLILNLNEPNALGDVSWVRPLKYLGIWWEMHLGRSTWSVGPRHAATTANAKHYIDFAAQSHIPGLLIEGWNKGWDSDWVGNGQAFEFAQATEDFDLAEVALYAQEHGVQLIGHAETGGNMAHYEEQMEDNFRLYSNLGIHSVKTGYVADGGSNRMAAPDGSIHFGYTDSQEASRHFVRNVTAAAQHHISIDSHEPIKPTGLRRTYPNCLSSEGSRGEEWNAWGHPPNPPEHVANLLFTRMLAGPFDYTPGILSLQGDKQPLQGTQAKELALYVLLYSPVQMAADLPEHYAQYPQAFKFIQDVPVDWDQTRMLSGEPGEYAVIARKDRHSADWYVGATSNAQPRTLAVPLRFLDPGQTYTAQIYRDGPGAHWQGAARFKLKVETRQVRAQDSLRIAIAPGGGFAVRLTPAKP